MSCCSRIAIFTCLLAYHSTHTRTKMVVVPTFLSCGLFTNARDCGVSLSSIADGANEEDNGPVGLGSCRRGKTWRNGSSDIFTQERS